MKTMIYKFRENRVRRAYFGGSRIDKFAGNEGGEDGRYPEEWLASVVTAFNPDMPKENEGLSVLEDGRYFIDVLKENSESMLGERCEDVKGAFSILVKLLDSAGRLVIQCHPTVEFAKDNFNSPFGKTECWYILDADDDANVYLGFKEGITRERWVELFEKQDIQGMLDCLHNFKVKAGDLWFVAGGVPHAIGGGCFMIELQEPSDLMVIPERVSTAGVEFTEEKLHCGLGFERMFDVYSYEGCSAEETKRRYYRRATPTKNALAPIVDEGLTDKFKMQILRASGEARVNFSGSYAMAIVTEGSCKITVDDDETVASRGDKFFLPAKTGDVLVEGEADIVFCTKF